MSNHFPAVLPQLAGLRRWCVHVISPTANLRFPRLRHYWERSSRHSRRRRHCPRLLQTRHPIRVHLRLRFLQTRLALVSDVPRPQSLPLSLCCLRRRTRASCTCRRRIQMRAALKRKHTSVCNGILCFNVFIYYIIFWKHL